MKQKRFEISFRAQITSTRVPGTDKSHDHISQLLPNTTKNVVEKNVPLQYDPSRYAYNHNFPLQSLATIEQSTILRNIINSRWKLKSKQSINMTTFAMK